MPCPADVHRNHQRWQSRADRAVGSSWERLGSDGGEVIGFHLGHAEKNLNPDAVIKNP